MGIRQSGFINSVSTSIFLVLLLSIGLYIVAMNPRIAGFEVQPGSAAPRYTTTSANYYQPSAQDRLISGDELWESSRRDSNVRCEGWHEARRGDTQWDLAAKYVNQSHWSWIRTMRQLSGKSANDDTLKAGESVCVKWK